MGGIYKNIDEIKTLQDIKESITEATSPKNNSSIYVATDVDNCLVAGHTGFGFNFSNHPIDSASVRMYQRIKGNNPNKKFLFGISSVAKCVSGFPKVFNAEGADKDADKKLEHHEHNVRMFNDICDLNKDKSFFQFDAYENKINKITLSQADQDINFKDTIKGSKFYKRTTGDKKVTIDRLLSGSTSHNDKLGMLAISVLYARATRKFNDEEGVSILMADNDTSYFSMSDEGTKTRYNELFNILGCTVHFVPLRSTNKIVKNREDYKENVGGSDVLSTVQYRQGIVGTACSKSIDFAIRHPEIDFNEVKLCQDNDWNTRHNEPEIRQVCEAVNVYLEKYLENNPPVTPKYLTILNNNLQELTSEYKGLREIYNDNLQALIASTKSNTTKYQNSEQTFAATKKPVLPGRSNDSLLRKYIDKMNNENKKQKWIVAPTSGEGLDCLIHATCGSISDGNNSFKADKNTRDKVRREIVNRAASDLIDAINACDPDANNYQDLIFSAFNRSGFEYGDAIMKSVNRIRNDKMQDKKTRIVELLTNYVTKNTNTNNFHMSMTQYIASHLARPIVVFNTETMEMVEYGEKFQKDPIFVSFTPGAGNIGHYSRVVTPAMPEYKKYYRPNKFSPMEYDFHRKNNELWSKCRDQLDTDEKEQNIDYPYIKNVVTSWYSKLSHYIGEENWYKKYPRLLNDFEASEKMFVEACVKSIVIKAGGNYATHEKEIKECRDKMLSFIRSSDSASSKTMTDAENSLKEFYNAIARTNKEGQGYDSSGPSGYSDDSDDAEAIEEESSEYGSYYDSWSSEEVGYEDDFEDDDDLSSEDETEEELPYSSDDESDEKIEKKSPSIHRSNKYTIGALPPRPTAPLDTDPTSSVFSPSRGSDLSFNPSAGSAPVGYSGDFLRRLDEIKSGHNNTTTKTATHPMAPTPTFVSRREKSATTTNGTNQNNSYPKPNITNASSRTTISSYYNGSPVSPNLYYAISAHSAQRKASVPSSPLASRLSPKKMTNNELAEELGDALAHEISKILGGKVVSKNVGGEVISTIVVDEVILDIPDMLVKDLKDRGSSGFKNKIIDSVAKEYPNSKNNNKSTIGLRLDRAFDAKVKKLLQDKRNKLPAWFVDKFANNRATIDDFCNRNNMLKGNTRW